MANHALLYRPNSRWRIGAAFAVAALLHISAVALARYRELPNDLVPDVVDVPVEGTSPDTPPPVEEPVPDLLPAVIPSEFPDEAPTHPMVTRRMPLAPIRRPSGRSAPTANPKTFAVVAPRPVYPYEARSRYVMGSGVAALSVDPTSGNVTAVRMAQSTGSSILDNAALSAFRSWRFKSGTVSTVTIPITFTLSGAQY